MKQTYCWWCQSELTEKPKQTCASLDHLKEYITILEDSYDLDVDIVCEEEEYNEED